MPSSTRPLTLCEVLLEEAAAMSTGQQKEAALNLLQSSASEAQAQSCRSSEAAERVKIFALLHDLQRSAICFSGGGIRSATFGLGVLQGLAQLSKKADGILRSLHFMSTVSGGGYLGAWLSRW